MDGISCIYDSYEYKQLFIAYDKQDDCKPVTKKILKENAVICLSYAIKELKMVELAQIMYDSIDDFEQKLLKAIDSEQGERLLSKVTRSIYDNIQLKLLNLLEEA